MFDNIIGHFFLELVFEQLFSYKALNPVPAPAFENLTSSVDDPLRLSSHKQFLQPIFRYYDKNITIIWKYFQGFLLNNQGNLLRNPNKTFRANLG
jgi:hypothetical protein